VAAADERGVTVLAVPGSVRSPASEGTNFLIADGCGVARDAPDVLAALELACAGAGRCLQTGAAVHLRDRPAAGAATRAVPGGSGSAQNRLSAAERAVFEALDDVAILRARVRALGIGARSDGGRPRPARDARACGQIGLRLGATRRRRCQRLSAAAQPARSFMGSTQSRSRAVATAAFVQLPRTVLKPARSTGSAAAAPSTPCSASATR
jgi:hypothetical protein